MARAGFASLIYSLYIGTELYMSYIPKKAYKNLDFLNSPPARHIRILCEYEETQQRFIEQNVNNTVVFLGLLEQNRARNLKTG